MRDEYSFLKKYSSPLTAAEAREILLSKQENKRNKINSQVSQIIHNLIESADSSGDDRNWSVILVYIPHIEYWGEVKLNLEQLGYKVCPHSVTHDEVSLPKK